MRTRPTCGRLELPGLTEDYRQGHALQKAYTIVRTLQKPPGGFCQGACLGRAALNRHPVPEWVYQQVYLHPYRKELMLRNHV